MNYVKETESQYHYTFSGRENLETSRHLRDGEICKVTGVGNSMLPYLKSRQSVICIPVDENTPLEKKDIVLSKVNGNFYLHNVYVKETTKSLVSWRN